MTLNKPKNQYALVIWYLIQYHKVGFSMRVPVNDHFYKFQSRLCDVLKGREDKIKINKLPMTAKNRFGHTMTYKHYKSLASKGYLITLYNSLNKNGINSKR